MRSCLLISIFSLLLAAWPATAKEAESLIPVTSESLLEAVKEADAKLVVVNVWATWCVPCRLEFPHFVKFRETYRDQGVEVYFVSADFEESLPAARKFLKEQGATWKNFHKNEKDQPFINSLSEEWSGALPATFIYDQQGNLLTFWEAEVTYDQLEERVTAHLN